LAFFQK